MSKDTPRSDPPPRIRGKEAEHAEPATLLSWLSSLLYVLSVPGAALLAYLGFWYGLYPPMFVLVVYPIIFISVLAVIAYLMRFRTTVR